MYNRLLLFMLLAFTTAGAYAQTSEKEKAILAIKDLFAVYKNNGPVSFDVLYRYAAEDRPGIWLDSLAGKVKISGDHYSYAMDNTESISTATYTIMLFKEDMVMYIAKPSSAQKLMNPLAQLDSFLSKNKEIRISLRIESGVKKIELVFPAGSVYKKIEYLVDHKSGFLAKMIMIIKSGQLYEPSARELIANSNQYAIMEVRFDQYHHENFNEKEFDPSRYFKKEGKEYITVAPYNNYKIFLGTPDL